MSTAASALKRYNDPVTRRIYVEIARRRLAINTVMQLSEILPTTWMRRAQHGNWRTKELQRIARALDVSFPWLVNALNDDRQVGERVGAA